MAWTAFKVKLRLLSPLHIGASKQGNLQITRPYVHGKALWGALTARLTRDTPVLANDYEIVGHLVNDVLAFSYFYPTTSDQVELWPWEDPVRFAWHFLGSHASTALDYNHNAAAEGSLHETEFIAPTERKGKPVYLVGYILEKEDTALPWRQALSRLQIGGERTYGWGRVAPVGDPEKTTTLFGQYELHLGGDWPEIDLSANDPLLAHALAHGSQAIPATGRVVPLVGRETKAADAHGRHLSQAMVCWEPGSVVDSTGRVIIGPYGIWEAVSP